MIEIAAAEDLIRQHCGQLAAIEVALPHAAGHVLAEPLTSDIDSPPFDKAMMDGFAIRAADFAGGQREFPYLHRIMAGADHQRELQPGTAVAIMTGAPIPVGADAVIMVEQTRTTDQTGSPRVTIMASQCQPGQNIMPRATAMSRGQLIKPPGGVIEPHEIGILAEAGVDRCRVIPRPVLAIVATGDELVPVNQRPDGSRIRNSNGPMIAAMAGPFCRSVRDLGIARDDASSLREKIRDGLQSGLLVLSGGVSAGKADLVPGILDELGVVRVFHKVAIKPGKPIWFGVHTPDQGPAIPVFGLPGNPVSSMCCFHLFVRRALRQLAGIESGTETVEAVLTVAHRQRGGRTTFWPSRLMSGSGSGPQVRPLDWKGSADLLTLAHANALAVFDGQREQFAAGEAVPVVSLV